MDLRLAVLACTYQGLEAPPTSPVMGTFRTRSCTELLGPLVIITLRKASTTNFSYTTLVLQRRVMRKHAQVFFFSYGPFIMGDSHSFVASFKIRPRVTL